MSVPSIPFPNPAVAASADHDQVVEHRTKIDSLQAAVGRLEAKLDRLTGWIIGVLVSAVGALIVSIFNLIRHNS